MTTKFDAPTDRVCRVCHERHPLHHFRPLAGPKARAVNMTCDGCRDHSAIKPHEHDPYIDNPRPFVRRRLPLPALDTTPECPRCGKGWTLNTRCVGYFMTDCGEYVPHYHRRCLACSREILEADPARTNKAIKPLPFVGMFMWNDLGRGKPAMPNGPDGASPDLRRHPDHHVSTQMNPRFAAIARQLMEGK